MITSLPINTISGVTTIITAIATIIAMTAISGVATIITAIATIIAAIATIVTAIATIVFFAVPVAKTPLLLGHAGLFTIIARVATLLGPAGLFTIIAHVAAFGLLLPPFCEGFLLPRVSIHGLKLLLPCHGLGFVVAAIALVGPPALAVATTVAASTRSARLKRPSSRTVVVLAPVTLDTGALLNSARVIGRALNAILAPVS
jgi:hypothetical protein